MAKGWARPRVPQEWPRLPDMPKALTQLVRQVPPGRLTTYGDLARALGDVRAARWVAEELSSHRHTAACGCHRVVRLTGEPGGSRSRPLGEVLARLIDEGVPVSNDRVELDGRRLTDFKSTAPLIPLLEWQREIAAAARSVPLTSRPRLIAGVDVAYTAAHAAIAAGVVCDGNSFKTVWEGTQRLPAPFPYIPGYLTFRELPPLVLLWKTMCANGVRPDLVMVDGNGRLHPRRAGIAVALGVVLDLPTIGIGKSLLCGSVDLGEMTTDDERPIIHAGEHIGMAIRNREESRPIFVSVGHRIDLPSAVALTRQAFADHRLPEPVFHADRLSKAAARPGRGK